MSSTATRTPTFTPTSPTPKPPTETPAPLPPEEPPPQILKFESDKSTLNPGEHALLTYEVMYADEANIDWWMALALEEGAEYDSGTVAYPYDELSSGYNNVCLHVSNSSDVDVYCLGLTAATPALPPPEIITFESDKYALSPGEYATLYYEVMNAVDPIRLNDLEFDTDENSAEDTGMHRVRYEDLSADSNQFCLSVSNGVDAAEECLWIEKQSAPSTIILNNNSGSRICRVYISPDTDLTWGDDWLGDDTIPPGGSYTFSLTSGIYDLLAQDCDYNDLSDLRDVEISGTFNIWNVP